MLQNVLLGLVISQRGVLALVELQILLLVLSEAVLKGSEIVVYHHPVDNELFLGLEFEDAGHGEIEGHPLHQPLNYVNDYLDQVDLVDQDLLHLGAVHKREVLVARVLSYIFSHDSQVLLEGGREALEELLVDGLELLHGDVLEGEGPRLYDAGDVIFLDVEGEDFEEFQDLGIQLLEIDSEVAG